MSEDKENGNVSFFPTGQSLTEEEVQYLAKEAYTKDLFELNLSDPEMLKKTMNFLDFKTGVFVGETWDGEVFLVSNMKIQSDIVFLLEDAKLKIMADKFQPKGV